MRAHNRLNALSVKNAPVGKHCDGGGLWFVKRADGGAQWVLRVSCAGTRVEMGLGSFRDVSLAEARREAEKWRGVAREGRNPVKARSKERRIAAQDRPTLGVVVEEAFEARKAELKEDGAASRWDSPLRLHVLPKLGRLPVEEIDQNDLKRVLDPIWHSKPEAARKALNRIRIVMRHAAAMGLEVDLQAPDKAKALLGKQRREVTHVPSMPWADAPAFWRTLTNGGSAELALKLLILTAVRSSEARGLRLDEIEGDVWTIPAERMKGGRSHRVPLSAAALDVIEEAEPLARDGYLFPGRGSRTISDVALSGILKKGGYEARPHGFRASFRTWCAEATDVPREVAETCLAHVSASKVEAAYRRTDYLEARRVLMDRWASWVTKRIT